MVRQLFNFLVAFMRAMICSTQTGEISHTKFWTNIAYLAGTVAFVKANWTSTASVDIWCVYLGVVGGHGVLSKFISMRYGDKHE
jgi:hypothetical protein